MDDLKMQKQTLKKAYKKTKRKHITPWKILAIICAVVMIVSIPLSILLQKFDNTMAARFGGSFWKLQNEDANAQYYTSDFNSAEEMVNYGLALTQQVEAEGAALLMNNNNALPLAADAKVSTFSSSGRGKHLPVGLLGEQMSVQVVLDKVFLSRNRRNDLQLQRHQK